jgi:predicted MFS family arabinose efflux permease
VFGSSVAGLVVGVIVLDLGMQGTHVPNQARVFGLDETARGRLNALYMVTCFLGAALGSAAGAQAWARGGWPGVSAVGGGLLVAALGAHALLAPPARAP